MRKVRLSVAMSVDAYIAGPNGENDWIVMDPDIDFGELMGSFDTVLLGRKSYEAAGMGGGMPGMKAIVFSRSLRQEDVRGATLSDDVLGTVSALKEALNRASLSSKDRAEEVRQVTAPLRIVDDISAALH